MTCLWSCISHRDSPSAATLPLLVVLQSSTPTIKLCVQLKRTASVIALTKHCSKWKETHKVKAELLHVFLKHKNEKTYWVGGSKGDVDKRADSCTERQKKMEEGWRRWQWGVRGWGGYKPNGTLMVNGGLCWHVLSHTIFYSPCSCCYAFLYRQPPPCPAPPSLLWAFLWLIALAKSLKRRPAVMHCKTIHFINNCVLNKNFLKTDRNRNIEVERERH